MRVYASTAAELAHLYKALGDETRVRIAHLLARRGELCVCDVETILSISQTKASRHLNYLKQVGIVQDRRDGTWVYYRLAQGARPALRAAIRELRRELAEDPVALGDLERAESCAAVKGCNPVVAVAERRRARSAR